MSSSTSSTTSTTHHHDHHHHHPYIVIIIIIIIIRAVIFVDITVFTHHLTSSPGTVLLTIRIACLRYHLGQKTHSSFSGSGEEFTLCRTARLLRLLPPSLNSLRQFQYFVATVITHSRTHRRQHQKHHHHHHRHHHQSHHHQSHHHHHHHHH